MLLTPAILCVALLSWPCSGQPAPAPSPANLGLVLQRNDQQYHVRLFNSSDSGQYIHGALELSRDGQSWGYTCAEDVDRDTGHVICKMFGYSKGEVLANGILGQSSNRMFSTKIICDATDSTLEDCFEITNRNSCPESQTVGIICFNDTSAVFDMRLVDGVQSATHISGRLEVRLTPVTSWGTVCDDSFNGRSATAACRYLGFKHGEFSDTGAFGSGEQTFLDEVYCDENQSFLDCDHDAWGLHDCFPSEDVGIECMNTSVRLLSAMADDQAVGSVELFVGSEGGWFEVCDENWDDNDAKVVCRELGFVDGKALRGNSLGLVSYGSLTALGSVTRVGCNGSETNLNNCSMDTIDLCEFSDSIIDLAAVICYNKPVSEVNMTDAVRIVADSGASEKVGYLEIRHLGVWGRVCEDSRVFDFPPMSDAEATVACRMAGYVGGKKIRSVSSDSTHHIWLRGMKCNGTEASIDECHLPFWGTPGLLECSAPVRVLCYDESLPKVIPHPSQDGERTGYLGISLDGQVSFVCADKWTPSAASVACHDLGYSTGTMWTHSGGLERIFDTDTALIDYMCGQTSTSFLDCIIGDFGTSRSQCVKGIAGYACYDNLKLDPTHGFTGVPQIFENSYGWTKICNYEFNNNDASVICRQLGYPDGEALPPASFGPLAQPYTHRGIKCNGSETDVNQCSPTSPIACGLGDARFAYASVSCFNVSETSGSDKYRLREGYTDSFTASGTVQVWRHNAWGFACDEFFTDFDAHVFCQELGRSQGVNYLEGIKFSPKESIQGPFWLRKPGCAPKDTHFANCSNQDYTCTESRAATVICSTTEKARFILTENEGLFSGRVQVAVNDHVGAICADTWDDQAATVFCRQHVKNAVTGIARLYTRSKLPLFLSGLSCFGNEDNLFECQNDGWRNIPSEKKACQQDAQEAGVECYTNVILTDGNMTSQSLFGRLSVIRYSSQRAVCFDDYFQERHARIACKELGFSQANILKPNPPALDFNTVKILDCPNDVTTLADCRYSTGHCSFGQVRLLCHNEDVLDLNKWKILGNSKYGPVVRHLADNFMGIVCPLSFSDENATIICRNKTSSLYGKSLGSPNMQINNTFLQGREPVWFGSLNNVCTTSGGVHHCKLNSTVPRNCFNQSHASGVLCTDQSDIRIRFVDRDRETTMAGRVEIRYNGVWGTICRTNLSNNEANTVCRERGFPGGRVLPRSPKQFGQIQNSSYPIYLKDVQCDEKEMFLLGCGNSGWQVTNGCTHEDDLEIICDRYEELFPRPSQHYGAVVDFMNGVESLVCDNGFGVAEAQVFCRGQGYMDGVPICCSGLYPYRNRAKNLPIAIQTSCQGNEPRLANCTKTFSSIPTCRTFASVACLTHASADRYHIRLNQTDGGLVYINYYDIEGMICNDDVNTFTHADAQVVCRQAGYYYGLAFASLNVPNTLLYWTSNLHCSGTEADLRQCPGFSLGQTPNCYNATVVKCLNRDDPDTINVKLIGSLTRGKIQVQIKNQWGSLCLQDRAYRSPVNDKEANVLCRQLGFHNGGNFLPPDAFDGYAGRPRPLLSGIRCHGNETSIKQCRLSAYLRLMPQNCEYGNFGDGLECYAGAQLRMKPYVPDHSRGILYVRKDKTSWHPVCDTGITDREATVVCRDLGFSFGKSQCCNAIGGAINMRESANTITCQGNESEVSRCSISYGGTCTSGQYAYVYCSNTAFLFEGLKTLPMNDFYGNATIERFGVKGGVCADGFGDEEASVMCKELGYFSGQAISPFSTKMDYIFLLKGINCTGNETKISECSIPTFSKAGLCASNKGAMILCHQSIAEIKATIGNIDGRLEVGLAKLTVNGDFNYILADGTNQDVVASVFCRSVDSKQYMYGSSVNLPTLSSVFKRSVLMRRVHCEGEETDILDCQATFEPRSLFGTIESSKLLHVQCNTGIQVIGGPTSYSGILSLYNHKMKEFGAVCMKNFGQNEADVACRQMGYSHSTLHCCRSFGYTALDIIFRNVKCKGTEMSLQQCEMEAASQYSYYFCENSQDYVGLTCQNNLEPQVFNISIKADTAANLNTGVLQMTYLGVTGTICNDGWGDTEAMVACRQLGYASGSAYFHYFSRFSATAGPFWTRNVTCQGTESSLDDCNHHKFGKMTKCDSGHYAGVLCHTGSALEFRISGEEQDHFGRVEVLVDNQWGTLCDIYWDMRDASVMCRTMGYVSGDVYNTQGLHLGTDYVPAFELKPRCNGTEEHINQCPHEGFTSGKTSSCLQHNRDAGVFCYTSVRLGTGSGKSANHGPVNYYHNGEWVKVCDDGFTDVSARKVCQELGFFDGRAICCSAYDGESSSREKLHPNITIKCQGAETSLNSCIQQEPCSSGTYASVVCFEEMEFINETYRFSMREDFHGAGRIDVSHMGVQGRICTKGWSDKEAQVYCKSKNFYSGFAYLHSYDQTYISAINIGPYWVTDMDCNGTESSLEECSFKDRLHLENCTGGHTAAAVCINMQGVRYRLEGGLQPNAGRIAMAVDYQWGTVCNRNWDNNDSRVVCRSLGYTDGVSQDEDLYGPGTGPIWLSYPQCQGDESALHLCPHTGFDISPPDEGILAFLSRPCRSHSDDAAVFCYKDVKLNQRLGSESGALLYSADHMTWQHVCNIDSFTRTEAQVACRSLMLNYVDGMPIKGGVFGDLSTKQGVSSIHCTGSELTLSECTVVANTNCSSTDYISVACFKQMLTPDDTKFQVRLADDSLRTLDNHGIVEIRDGGVWGRICMDGFTNREANITCKSVGNFTGGTTYLHLFKNRLPMLWGKTTCSGDEVSINQCHHESPAGNENCGYDANDAGVLCYRGEGIKYRLTGLASRSKGRVEVGVDGDYGTICAVNWKAANSRVLCRSLGYVDGIPSRETNEDLPSLPTKLSFFMCEGSESSLLSCLNSGFDGGRLVLFCGGEAYTDCFNSEVEITDIRLGDNAKTTGRVEVKVTGLDEWGTVCDDKWDDADATVVCRFLGFDAGRATFEGHAAGNGKILLDNVECVGNETSLSECLHQGINSHNCEHSEDAGVECFNMTTTAAPATAVPATTTTTTKAPLITARPPTTTTKQPEMTTRITEPIKPMSPKGPPTKRPTTPMTPTSSLKETLPEEPSSGKSTGSSSSTSSIVIAVVAVLVALILIVVVVLLLLRFRIRRKGAGGSDNNGFNHVRFTNEDIMQRGPDGSIGVSNQMYDITGASDTSFMAEGAEIRLGSSGLASYSKTPPNVSASTNEGFSNPLYGAAREATLVSPTEVIMKINGEQSNSDL